MSYAGHSLVDTYPYAEMLSKVGALDISGIDFTNLKQYSLSKLFQLSKMAVNRYVLMDGAFKWMIFLMYSINFQLDLDPVNGANLYYHYSLVLSDPNRYYLPVTVPPIGLFGTKRNCLPLLWFMGEASDKHVTVGCVTVWEATSTAFWLRLS